MVMNKLLTFISVYSMLVINVSALTTTRKDQHNGLLPQATPLHPFP